MPEVWDGLSNGQQTSMLEFFFAAVTVFHFALRNV